MIVESIRLRRKIKEKIETKHSITLIEIEKVLLENNPKFRKAKDCFIGMGLWKRHLTIFFNYNAKVKEAGIITAYPSSKWQIKLYKQMK
ncbi:hypothetical protein J4443_01380 [Candidatus Woesearchaeota archaeon]|nr:hypothetical protein [Candidatus Woesearchaeota archaeon]